ncbi:hypothetical protein F5887DRAFT_989660 [Amanita rubescens]|nr:hypothetical protein F5887DRAFT_989660 [Amanita rubescens]
MICSLLIQIRRDYEVLFIVDDSASMRGSRWLEARDALIEIAEYALKLNVRTVSLRFLNNGTYDRGLQGASALMSRFDRVQPNGTSCAGCHYIPDIDRLSMIGSTPIGAVLQVVFNEHLNRIDDAVSNPHLYSKIPPLDIIVLTDGVPTDDPASVIASAVRRLKNKRYHPNTMGVQFVQIADDPGARPVLVDLVKGDNGSIVDTVPYRGVVTSEKLQRILLGGIHPNIRAMLPISLLGT